jgi:hypothetical protein
MAEMTIHLRCDPATGKKDIIVSLKSDEDALPMEHEQQHKALVEKLIHGGLLHASEVGKVVVEREESKGESTGAAGSESQTERRSLAQGE